MTRRRATARRAAIAAVPAAGRFGTAIAAIALATIALAGVAFADTPAPAGDHAPASAQATPGSATFAAYLPWAARRDGESARAVARLGGDASAVAIRGRLVYAGMGDRIATYALDDAGRPALVAASPPFDAPVRAIEVVEQSPPVVVALIGSGGIHAFAAFDDGLLDSWSVIAVPGDVHDVAVAPGTFHGYLALGTAGVGIVDLAPRAVPVAGFAPGSGPGRLARYGGGAGWGAGLFGRLDTRRSVPAQAGPADLRWRGRLAVEGDVRRVVATSGHLFVAKADGYIALYGLGDPDRPQLVWLPASIRCGESGDLADLAVDSPPGGLDPTRLVCAMRGRPGNVGAWSLSDNGPSGLRASAPIDDALAIATEGNAVFGVTSAGGVARFGVRSPLALEPDGTASVPGGRAVAAAGGRVVVARGPGGISVLHGDTLAEVAHDAPPGAVAAVVPTGPGQVLAALTEAPAGLTAIWADPDGRLRPAGFLPLGVQSIADVTLRAPRGRPANYAYVLYYNALEAIDLSAPGAPEKRRTLAVPDATAMAIDGRYIYVAGDGLRVIDADAPDDPREVAYVFRGRTGEAVAAAGDRVYVAQRLPTGARLTDLWVFDVANRAAPRQIGTLANIEHTVALAAAPGYVYQVYDQDRRYGLRAYDARDPAAVRRLDGAGTFATDGLARGVVRDGDRLLLIEEAYFDRVNRRERGRTGVHVLDIGQPDRPVARQFLPFAAPVRSVDAAGGKLYVAAGAAGLYVFEIDAGSGRYLAAGRE